MQMDLSGSHVVISGLTRNPRVRLQFEAGLDAGNLDSGILGSAAEFRLGRPQPDASCARPEGDADPVGYSEMVAINLATL